MEITRTSYQKEIVRGKYLEKGKAYIFLQEKKTSNPPIYVSLGDYWLAFFKNEIKIISIPKDYDEDRFLPYQGDIKISF